MRQTSLKSLVSGLAIIAAVTFGSTALAAQEQPRGLARIAQGATHAQPRSAPAPRGEQAPRQRSAAPQPAPSRPSASTPQQSTVQRRGEARVPPAVAPSRGGRIDQQRTLGDRRPGGSVVVRRPPVRAYRAPRTVITRRVHVPVVVYSRPYYTFRPRYLLGFGLYLGEPVPYPFAFGYPNYVYDPYNSYLETTVRPSPDSYGGVSFDVDPEDTEVAVDGVDVGYASDFSPERQPLTLTPGQHHIELSAPGLEPIEYDVQIYPGEVVPFEGSLN